MSVPLNVALFEYLRARPAISALVGLLDDAKIYPHVAPEGQSPPFLIFKRRDYDPEHHMGGASGLATVDMRIEVHAENSAQAGTLSEAIRDALDGKTGQIGTSDPVTLGSTRCTDQDDGFIRPRTGGPAASHRTYMEFEFKYYESIPTL